MKYTGRFCYSEATEEEINDRKMEDEISEQRQQLNKYVWNINSLLGKDRAKEVYKSMINFLIEQL